MEEEVRVSPSGRNVPLEHFLGPRGLQILEGNSVPEMQEASPTLPFP